jgi:hypothetical protein
MQAASRRQRERTAAEKRRVIGICRFIGCLFAQGAITARSAHFCIVALLNQGDIERVDADLVRTITNIGALL